MAWDCVNQNKKLRTQIIRRRARVGRRKLLSPAQKAGLRLVQRILRTSSNAMRIRSVSECVSCPGQRWLPDWVTHGALAMFRQEFALSHCMHSSIRLVWARRRNGVVSNRVATLLIDHAMTGSVSTPQAPSGTARLLHSAPSSRHGKCSPVHKRNPMQEAL